MLDSFQRRIYGIDVYFDFTKTILFVYVSIFFNCMRTYEKIYTNDDSSVIIL